MSPPVVYAGAGNGPSTPEFGVGNTPKMMEAEPGFSSLVSSEIHRLRKMSFGCHSSFGKFSNKTNCIEFTSHRRLTALSELQ